MGQIDRTDLEQAADAVVRFIRWSQQVSDQEAQCALRYLRQVWDAQGDLSAATAPSSYRAEFEQEPLRNSPFWSIRFWSESEFESARAGAGWFYRFGKEWDPPEPWSLEQQRSDLRAFLEQTFGSELNAADEAVVDGWEPMPDLAEALELSLDGMFVELAVTLGADGRTIRVEWDFDGEVSQSFPQVLKEPPWLGGPQRSEVRQRLQELDARDSSINVRVDPSWNSELVRESVMAQVVEYLLRTNPQDEPLTGDALDQYIEWTARVAGSSPSPELESEAAKMALRSVRPPTAAAHHTYVKRSLRPRGRDLVGEAASKAEISRSTAYERLRRAGKSAAEFRASADPVGELARFLVAERPARFLTNENHIIRDALIEAGMQKEAARKLESRTRKLDKGERARRLERAIKRARARKRIPPQDGESN